MGISKPQNLPARQDSLTNLLSSLLTFPDKQPMRSDSNYRKAYIAPSRCSRKPCDAMREEALERVFIVTRPKMGAKSEGGHRLVITF